MTEKRRPHLRDEVSASLAGLDDLAADLFGGPAEVVEAAEPAEPRQDPASLAELDPEITAQLAEVRALADVVNAPPEEVDEGIYEEVAQTAKTNVASPDLVFEAVANHTAGSGGINAATEMGAESRSARSPAIEPPPPPAEPPSAAASAPDPPPAPVEPARGSVSTEIPPADPSSAPARPWTPAAAMEPVPPLAPPPSRPLTALAETTTTRMPADGGRKMNILPVLMIGLIVILIIVAAVLLIKHH